MFYVPLAGVSPCFSSAAICLFLHLLSLLFLNRGRANRHLCMWERLKGLTPPPLHVRCPSASTTWLGVHIMDHTTEQAWTVAESLLCWYILLPKSDWLQGAQIIICFFLHRHGIPLLVSSLKIACLRIVSHPGQDIFSYKRLAGVHACGDVQIKWIFLLMYLLYFQFQIKTCTLYGKKKRGRERGCRVLSSHVTA